MKKAFTVLGIAFAFVLFLSITIKNKTIFNHIYAVISPMTTATQDMTQNLTHSGYQSVHSYTKKLFDNSVPKVRDSIRSKQAAIKKQVAEPQENITQEEKSELDQLIKNRQ